MPDRLRIQTKSLIDLYRNETNKAKPFEVRNGSGETDILIYDVIDSWFGVDVQDIVNQLNSIDTPTINVRLNSPGGNVFDGTAIMTALANHSATINTYIDGVAASMASGIAMSGSKRVMAENAWMMIHDPMMVCWGNSRDMLEAADMLDRHAKVLANNYSKRTIQSNGATHDEIVAAMQEETWYTADEALAAGLIDEIAETVPIENTWTGAFNFCNAPDNVQDLVINTNKSRIETRKEFKNFLVGHGFSTNMAESITLNGFSPELRNAAGADSDELCNAAAELVKSIKKATNTLR